MRRNLLLAGLPVLVLGSLLLPVSLIFSPMINLVSHEQRSIPRSEVVGRYHYADWPVDLSGGQTAEFQLSATRPVNFHIFDKENFDRWLQDQTNVVITSSLNEYDNTHSFTPTKGDTYVFVLQNTSGLDAALDVTVRRSFEGLEYIGTGILMFGGVLVTVGFFLRPKAVEIPMQVLEMVKMHRRIKISDLASKFSTSQTDIEMALLKLRIAGEPIVFEPITGEVSYGSPSPPPDTTPPPLAVSEAGPQG